MKFNIKLIDFRYINNCPSYGTSYYCKKKFKNSNKIKIGFEKFVNINHSIKMNYERIKISEIAKRYNFDLVRSGNSFKILCPFHEEKTPSLILNDELNSYHCFGCGASGNGFKLAKHLEANFSLNKNISKKINESKSLFFKSKIKQNKYIQQRKFFSTLIHSDCLWILQIAWCFYALNFQKNKLLKVLVFSRGISVGSTKIHGIGYAPRERNVLGKFLFYSSLKFTNILNSGIISLRKGNFNGGSLTFKPTQIHNFSEVFRDRLIIPIRTKHGVIIGFGGRIIGKINSAKYINSSDSNIFKKKRILFSEELIKTSFSKNCKTVVLTEGYLDSIGLFQNGVKFSLASLGTSLGKFQLERLHLLSQNFHIILYLDSDAAGKSAIKRIFDEIIEKLSRNHFCISVAKLNALQNLKDPDEFVYYKGSIELVEKVFNLSLPISKWFEIELLTDINFYFEAILCRDDLIDSKTVFKEKIDKFANKNFFETLLLKIFNFYEIVENEAILSKKKQFFTIFLNDENQQRFRVKKNFSLTNSEEAKNNAVLDREREDQNLFLILSLLFPSLRDDFFPISFASVFISPSYSDAVLRRGLLSTIYDIHYISISEMYTKTFKEDRTIIVNPSQLKIFLLQQLCSIDKVLSLKKDNTSIVNKIFNFFFAYILVKKRNKLKKKIKILFLQIRKIISSMENNRNIQLSQKLIILTHKANRTQKIVQRIIKLDTF